MKVSKRWTASCGPGPASGWYWIVRAGHVAEHEALDRAVVEVQVGQLGGAEVRLPAERLVALELLLAVRAEHGEAVVLRRDVDLARLEVLDRVVGAAVAERQLERLEPDRAAQELVAEADADHGRLADTCLTFSTT